MWEINNSLQVRNFLYSIVLGIILALLYDVFRAMRKLKKYSSLAIFFQDVIYFVLGVPIVFLFLLATTNGELRGFIFFGIMLGFILSTFSLSRVCLWILIKFLSFLKKIKDGLHLIFGKMADFFAEILEKTKKKLKKILKMGRNTNKKS